MAPVLSDSIIVFVVSLFIGAFGIYVGANVVSDTDDFSEAVFTALIGALVWAVVSFFFSSVPLIGPLLTLAAYIGVIKWRYTNSWLHALAIALIAWIVAIGVLSLLAQFNIGSFEAVGVPGLGRGNPGVAA